MVDLWHELSLLQNKLASQRMNILNVQFILDEVEVDVSHDKEESVQEPKEDELVTKINQGDERNLWNVVNKEEEESYVEFNDQHTEEMFEMSQVISEWMKILLKEVAINIRGILESKMGLLRKIIK